VDSLLESKFLKISELTDFVLDINFDEIDSNKLSKNTDDIRKGIHVIMKNGKISEISYFRPYELLTPVITYIDHKPFLGFQAETHHVYFKNGIFRNIAIMNFGPLLFLNPLWEIKQLKYFNR